MVTMTSDDYIKDLQTKVVQQTKEINRLNEKCRTLKKENYEYENLIGTVSEAIECFEDLKSLIKYLDERISRYKG